MSYQVINPFIQFVDPANGKPLSAGSVYFGRQDTDPKNQPSNRINVYAVQDNGSEVLLAQPITLNGAGQPQYSGSIKQLRVETYGNEESYSLQVLSRTGAQKGYSSRVYSVLDLAKLADPSSTVSIAGLEAKRIAHALEYTVTPEDFGTGADAIQLAINACSAAGGGTVLLGSKTYTVTQPIELKRKVSLIGVNPEATFIRKEAASTVDGIDAIIIGRDAELVNQFRIENICLIGNRTSRAAGNTVTTNGIFLNFAHFYIVRNVRIEQCARAYVANQNYVAVIERVTGLMCQGYAFDFYNGCTTISASNLLSWGCGGGYKIDATIYSTFRDCACDHSDAGGRPDDPFLPQGSGGDYLNPAYIWEITASRITITGAGCENSYSRWLYGEGAFVSFVSPFVFNLKGYSTIYRCIELRGTGSSRVVLTNPRFDISLDGTPSESRRMYFIDSPRNQILEMSAPVSGTASFGDFAHPVYGCVFSNYINLMSYTQELSRVGETVNNLIYTPADIEPTVTLVSGVKQLNIVNKTTDYKSILCPVTNQGALEIIMKGSHTSSVDAFNVRLIADDGVNPIDVLKTYMLSGSFDVRSYIYLNEQAALSAKPLYLELRSPRNTDTTFFTEFQLNRVV